MSRLGACALVAMAFAVGASSADAAGVRKCKRFSVGHRVITKCVRVPSAACKVKWSKRGRRIQADVSCPSGPIPRRIATYAIVLTGTVYSGSTAFLDTITTFTPVSRFVIAGTLVVEPPIGANITPRGQATNGVNARDIGFFVGKPIVGQAGALWLVTDSFLFSQVGINLPTAEVLDVAFVSANERAGTIAIRLDGNLEGLPYARALNQNVYGVTSGLTGELAQILTGDVALRFSANGRAVVGAIRVLGGGIIEPGSSAYQATFTGVRRS